MLWLGQSISRIGDQLYRVAIAWWVLDKTGSAAAMGTMLILTSAPMLLFLLIGGVFVDRFSRTRLMIISDLLRGGVVTFVTFFSLYQSLEVWHIYIASILFGFFDAFFQPAYIAAIPEVTPKEVLFGANAAIRISKDILGILGPIIGAFIINIAGVSVAFGLNALSFFVSAFFILKIRLSSVSITTKKATVLSDLKDGLSSLFSINWLWISILISSITNMTLFAPFFVAIPFLVKETFGKEITALGFVYSMYAVGSLVGALIFGQFKKIQHRGLVLYLTWMISGIILILIGLSNSIFYLLIEVFVFGGIISFVGLLWVTLLQELIPNNILGRIASIDQFGSFLLLPIGYGLVGLYTDKLGAPIVFIIGGIITTILFLLGVLHSSIRKLD